MVNIISFGGELLKTTDVIAPSSIHATQVPTQALILISTTIIRWMHRKDTTAADIATEASSETALMKHISSLIAKAAQKERTYPLYFFWGEIQEFEKRMMLSIF